jgi:hypothetical protein
LGQDAASPAPRSGYAVFPWRAIIGLLDSNRQQTLNARHPLDGAVAQLGERVVRNDEVRGSIPLSSTSGLALLE